MSENAFRRAERCFALARSTTFDGERSAAIAKGTAIAERAGLDLDRFNIPGRIRQPREFRDRLFEGLGVCGDNFRYVDLSVVDMETFKAVFREAMRQSNDLETERDRRERKRRQRYEVRLNDALNFLWSKGNRIHAVGDGSYFFEDRDDPAAILSEADVLAAAESRGWKR